MQPDYQENSTKAACAKEAIRLANQVPENYRQEAGLQRWRPFQTTRAATGGACVIIRTCTHVCDLPGARLAQVGSRGSCPAAGDPERGLRGESSAPALYESWLPRLVPDPGSAHGAVYSLKVRSSCLRASSCVAQQDANPDSGTINQIGFELAANPSANSNTGRVASAEPHSPESQRSRRIP